MSYIPQLFVVGCLVIVGIAFGICGVLRLQEVYLSRVVTLDRNDMEFKGKWLGKEQNRNRSLVRAIFAGTARFCATNREKGLLHNAYY